MGARRDCVVIMARGASRRMGQPKGLLPCPRQPELTFLQAIAAGYTALDIPVVVVTTFDLVAVYETELSGVIGAKVRGFPEGGETGRSLQHGWQTVEANVTHLWAHPVDMPLVAVATLKKMRAFSTDEPDLLIRPAHNDIPGHPVIIPSASMAGLVNDEIWQMAPMREVIAMATELGHIEQPSMVPVADAGVIQDFDSPADLKHFDETSLREDFDGSAR